MPLYDYECQCCGDIFEVKHGYNEGPIERLPDGFVGAVRACPQKFNESLPDDHPLKFDVDGILAHFESVCADQEAGQTAALCVSLPEHGPFKKLLPGPENLPMVRWKEGASPTELTLRGGYKGKFRKEMEALHRARTVSGIKDAKFDPRMRHNGEAGLFRESEEFSPRNMKAKGRDGREVKRVSS